MLVKLIERPNGGCYFIAAKFVDRSCQGTSPAERLVQVLGQEQLRVVLFELVEGMVCSSTSCGPPASAGD
jgi:hypothetical protein